MRTYKTARHRYLATVGDIHPADYGGGYLVRVYPDRQTPYLSLEYVEWESDADDARGYLFRADVPNDVCAEHDWADIPAVANTEGMPAEDFRKLATAANPVFRASAVRAIGDHYGWLNLDSYPLNVTRDDIRKRWARVRNAGSKPGV